MLSSFSWLPGGALGIFVIAGVLLVLWVLSRPIKLGVKLLSNAAVGFVLLFLANFIGKYIGLRIAVTWITCLIAGTFGVPGVIAIILYTLFRAGGLPF